MTNPLIIITGAMGGGKSTLLNTLSNANHTVIQEPARDILSEQRSISGRALPENKPDLFCELLLSRSLHLYRSQALSEHPVFFDRGIADCIAYARYFALDETAYLTAAHRYRYHTEVFFTPPWEAIYHTDDERKLSFQEATEFSHMLRKIYLSLGYSLIDLPKVSAEERVDFMLEHITTDS